MDDQTGIYEVISDVKIRREPRIVEGNTTNQVGLIKAGTHRRVFSVLTTKDNTTWGRVSFADAAGISEWVCIQGLNRVYMKLIEPDKDGAPADAIVMMKLDNLETTLARVEQMVAEIANTVSFLKK